MESKLTLKLDKAVIEKAKEYASLQNRSLSSIIESYLDSLTHERKGTKKNADIPITAFVKSMASGIQIPSDIDFKKLYSEHLNKKYK